MAEPVARAAEVGARPTSIGPLTRIELQRIDGHQVAVIRHVFGFYESPATGSPRPPGGTAGHPARSPRRFGPPH